MLPWLPLIELRDQIASASQELGLKVFTTNAQFIGFFFFSFFFFNGELVNTAGSNRDGGKQHGAAERLFSLPPSSA